VARFNAEKIAKAITQNVRDVTDKRITFAEFDAIQKRLWDQVSQGEQNIIGSACSRRHQAVSKIFRTY